MLEKDASIPCAAFIDFWQSQQHLVRIWETRKSKQKLPVCFTSRSERGPMGKALVLPSVVQPMQLCCCRGLNCHSYKSVELLPICGNGNGGGGLGEGNTVDFFPWENVYEVAAVL